MNNWDTPSNFGYHRWRDTDRYDDKRWASSISCLLSVVVLSTDVCFGCSVLELFKYCMCAYWQALAFHWAKSNKPHMYVWGHYSFLEQIKTLLHIRIFYLSRFISEWRSWSTPRVELRLANFFFWLCNERQQSVSFLLFFSTFLCIFQFKV